MAKQTVKTTASKTTVTIKPKSSGGPKKCPTCGKYMGSK